MLKRIFAIVLVTAASQAAAQTGPAPLAAQTGAAPRAVPQTREQKYGLRALVHAVVGRRCPQPCLDPRALVSW